MTAIRVATVWGCLSVASPLRFPCCHAVFSTPLQGYSNGKRRRRRAAAATLSSSTEQPGGHPREVVRSPKPRPHQESPGSHSPPLATGPRLPSELAVSCPEPAQRPRSPATLPTTTRKALQVVPQPEHLDSQFSQPSPGAIILTPPSPGFTLIPNPLWRRSVAGLHCLRT
jgi:hypothetical protein